MQDSSSSSRSALGLALTYSAYLRAKMRSRSIWALINSFKSPPHLEYAIVPCSSSVQHTTVRSYTGHVSWSPGSIVRFINLSIVMYSPSSSVRYKKMRPSGGFGTPSRVLKTSYPSSSDSPLRANPFFAATPRASVESLWYSSADRANSLRYSSVSMGSFPPCLSFSVKIFANAPKTLFFPFFSIDSTFLF